MAEHRLLLAAGSMLDADPLTLIDAAAGAGFDGVGLRLDVRPDGRIASDVELTAYIERARQQRIVIHDVEVYRISPSAADPAPLIEAAAALGAEAVLVVSDVPDLVVTERQLGVIATRCRRAGIVAAIEYMAWTTPSTPSAGRAVGRRHRSADRRRYVASPSCRCGTRRTCRHRVFGPSRLGPARRWCGSASRPI